MTDPRGAVRKLYWRFTSWLRLEVPRVLQEVTEEVLFNEGVVCDEKRV